MMFFTLPISYARYQQRHLLARKILINERDVALPITYLPKTIIRCPWLDLTKPDYIKYHDHEWGAPVHDDRIIFEFLTLEGAQAGLSWYTVLRKREAYRKAFSEFAPAKVARYGKRQLKSLLNNPGIIRNLQKIEGAINNAKRFLEVQQELCSFDAYIWRFVGGKPIVHKLRKLKDYPAMSPESDALSKDLNHRRCKFV